MQRTFLGMAEVNDILGHFPLQSPRAQFTGYGIMHPTKDQKCSPTTRFRHVFRMVLRRGPEVEFWDFRPTTALVYEHLISSQFGRNGRPVVIQALEINGFAPSLELQTVLVSNGPGICQHCPEQPENNRASSIAAVSLGSSCWPDGTCPRF